MRTICFVGLDNYPVLNPEMSSEYFGGESVQQTLLAKAFVQRGYDVSMVVADMGQPNREVIDGITVWKAFRKKAGLPIVRFVYPRMTSFFRALKAADADVYYQSCAGIYTGLVAGFCRQRNRKFIFRIAHDTDCIPGEQIINHHRWRDVPIYEYGLRKADLVAAQSVMQQKLLSDNYHRSSELINMVVQPPAEALDQHRDIDVLWVNNLRHFKRPELFIELAKMLPELSFTMIGGPVTRLEDYYSDLENRASAVSNLEFMGAVPYHQVNSYFARTKVFVNTSESEGFPNSFLQAWIRGVPVLSFFDPDRTIERNGLGLSPDGLDDMAKSLASLLADPTKLLGMSERARKFALENYSSEQVSLKYINWLEP